MENKLSKLSIQSIVKKLRILKQVTQESLSQELGDRYDDRCASETISRFETRSPGVVLTVPVLLRILKILGAEIIIKMDDLGSDNCPRSNVFEVDLDESI